MEARDGYLVREWGENGEQKEAQGKRKRTKGGRIEREEAKRKRIEEVKEGEEEVGREGGRKKGYMALGLRPSLGFQGNHNCKEMIDSVPGSGFRVL